MLAIGCIAGIPTLQASIIADSLADFSDTQGYNGWYYGFVKNQDLDTFTQLEAFINGNTWAHPGFLPLGGPFTLIYADGAHPNGMNNNPPGEEWAVRRYVNNDVDRLIFLTVELAKKDIRGGSGTAGRIFQDGTELWSMSLSPATYGNEYYYSTTIHLAPHDTLDFVVSTIDGIDAYGSTTFTATLDEIPEPGTFLLFGAGAIAAGLLRWHKRQEIRARN
jgi:hypothetical protein